MRPFVIVVALVFGSLFAHGQAAVPCVRKYVTNTQVTQHEFDALVDFTFNVGCGAFRGSTLLRKVNAGDMTGAANEFPKWIYAGGKPLRGLVKRRADERALFMEK